MEQLEVVGLIQRLGMEQDNRNMRRVEFAKEAKGSRMAVGI